MLSSLSEDSNYSCLSCGLVLMEALYQSGLGQRSNKMPSDENDQIPDDVDVLCIPILAEKITFVCCCTGSLTHLVSSTLVVSGVSGFAPDIVYASSTE